MRLISSLLVFQLGFIIFGYGLNIPFNLNIEELKSIESSYNYNTILNKLQEYFRKNNDQESISHYTTLDKQDWPINLEQYKDFQIIRFWLNSDNIEISQKLLKKYEHWEINNEFFDLKIDLISKNQIIKDYPNLKFDIIIDDLAQSIYETYPSLPQQHQKQDQFQINKDQDFHTQSDIFFKEYRPLSTIYAWLDILKETYPDLVEIEWLGQSYEGRDLKAVHLSSPTGLNPTKKTIVMTAGVHAREWISVSTVLFTIYQLLNKYGSNKKETEFLNKLDFLIIPVFNPDGYEYTWTTDRLWRKNRQETYIPRCFGIDIDHSFGYHWSRSEDFPCGESYSGELEFEAMEAANLDNYINVTKNDHEIYGFLDFHSYTQKILYPYAYSCDELPRDLENLLELSYGLSKSIRLKSGKHYEVLPACKDRGVDLLPGLGAGSSLDYMYHNRAHWAFQLKLRDTGSHGFLLPSNYIKPVGREIYSAVRYFCKFIINPDS
ncbi:Carboxypeptidase A4 [Wickerhamomyces ciferrii]|uniref:Inactive metallocarboxypeptidase ECM14 n=1 Tax=Wickerhamomyces ciferrii (strain ATCC 14091 / BCRC 22168 / CBS 111 / JCM 3599 / NBRC 0793 / NRRL Y-1031 F-60-10) TaxID=1206466 RepID=K0KG05_WICCF|nr:Carboxypeptidase A4 [Wickerhamomyces ciferrii]CCH41861.1 Carboxypeptidase A4 [Wickerhamomyces ciferrii]